ncbi:MAG: glycosyltransferase family 4 protein [Bacteroidales bacterium]|nr:glycosyltransferase family 4 protein [Bacteroidales bacterium]
MQNLLHIVPGNRMAGAQTYALDICRHYKEKGLNVFALTTGAHAVDSRFKANDIEVGHAPFTGMLDFTSIFRMARFLRRLPPGDTLIHVHRYRDAYTAILARFLAQREGIKIAATRHAVRKGRDSKIFRHLYNNIDAHIFVSKLAYERFCHSWEAGLKPIPEGKVHVLHNSLYLNPESLDVSEPERGPVTALYFGQVAERKGLENLIDALMAMRNVKMRLVIAGTGNPDFTDRLRKRAMIREVMDAIDWNTGCEDPSELIARTHFGVVPSVESEAFGLSNLRYMAYGKPQICTANGAQTEYLRDGETALMVRPGDTATLAEAMTRLATSPDLRREMGERAKREFEKALSWQEFTKKLDAIYEGCFR